VTTPIVLHSVGLMTTGNLHELASDGTAGFLAISVIIPSLLDILTRRLLGDTRITSARPLLKLVNSINLLMLNYANASVSLPQTIADPDWDFLAVILGIVITLCVLAFAAGWLIARWLKTDLPQQVSLMFGLGMNNNGTGLVLASMASPRAAANHLLQSRSTSGGGGHGLDSKQGESRTWPLSGLGREAMAAPGSFNSGLL
jgi:bile acid:Na+ symporter, BASS family